MTIMTSVDGGEISLRALVCNAMAAADLARRALYAGTCHGDYSHDLHRLADRLERRLAGYDIFEPGVEDLLLSSADRLAELACAETRTEFLPDEHCMSGGVEATRVTARGEALAAAAAALTDLAEALGDVHRYLAADRIVEQLLR